MSAMPKATSSCVPISADTEASTQVLSALLSPAYQCLSSADSVQKWFDLATNPSTHPASTPRSGVSTAGSRLTMRVLPSAGYSGRVSRTRSFGDFSNRSRQRNLQQSNSLLHRTPVCCASCVYFSGARTSLQNSS